MTGSIRDRLVAELVRLFGKHYPLYRLRPERGPQGLSSGSDAAEARRAKNDRTPRYRDRHHQGETR